MKNKLLLLFLLLSLTLSACQRETYPSTATPGAPETAGSTPTATPGLAANSNPATPRPDWETLYTEANPVSDPEELIAILQDLYDRFMAQFDRPGWYRFYDGEMGKDVLWVYIPEPETGQFGGLLELIDNPEYYAPGFIYPRKVMGPIGQVGFTHLTETMDDYYFVERPDVFSFLDNLDPTLDNLGYFSGYVTGGGHFGHLMLLGVIQEIRDPVYSHAGAHRESSYAGWMGMYEDQPAFVVKKATLYSGILPITESGERKVKEEGRTYFDLQNGGGYSNIDGQFLPEWQFWNWQNLVQLQPGRMVRGAARS